MTEHWPTFAEVRRAARERFTPTILALAGLFAIFASGITAPVLVFVFAQLELPVLSVLFFVTWALITAAAFFVALPDVDCPIPVSRVRRGYCMKYQFRLYCRETPGHMHCRVFVIKEDGDGLYESAMCGSLTVRRGSEFDALKRDFIAAEFLYEGIG